jgi:hypothetical protein
MDTFLSKFTRAWTLLENSAPEAMRNWKMMMQRQARSQQLGAISPSIARVMAQEAPE